MTAKQSPQSARSRAPRKPVAKPPRKCGTPGLFGKLTKEEMTPLLLQAKVAFGHQAKLGRIEPGMSFDDWRRDMVMDRVGLPGLSKINRSHWRAVMAGLLELSGREDEALKLALKSGVKTYRPVDQDDTWESCETYVALIQQKIAAHAQANVEHPKGHIREGWILSCARQRTGKPSLTIATLAERLDPETLCGLLSHLGNHISLREGRAVPERRKKRPV